ncbi:MAG TPA: thioredoxin domain-containing protein [Chthoniobacterales bacterium]
MRRYLPFAIIAAVLLVAIGGGLLLYRYRMEPELPPVGTPTPTATAPSSQTATTTAMASVTPSVSTTPTAPTAGPIFNYGRPGAEPMHFRGEGGAPAIVEEFGDFECLPCSLMWPILEKLEQDYDKRLVVVFREHPLKMHRFALDAARAAEAAGLQGKFWEMHDTLYRNRATWVPAAYIRPYLNDYAAELQLDLDRFKADMDGQEVARRLAADWDRGESLGIDRTPVIFVNGGKVLVTEHNEKGMREAIDKALGAKATAAPSP